MRGVCICVCVAQLCLTLVTPWTVAHQIPLSMGFSRQEYWGRLPCLSPNKIKYWYINKVPLSCYILREGKTEKEWRLKNGWDSKLLRFNPKAYIMELRTENASEEQYETEKDEVSKPTLNSISSWSRKEKNSPGDKHGFIILEKKWWKGRPKVRTLVLWKEGQETVIVFHLNTFWMCLTQIPFIPFIKTTSSLCYCVQILLGICSGHLPYIGNVRNDAN